MPGWEQFEITELGHWKNKFGRQSERLATGAMEQLLQTGQQTNAKH